MEVELEEVWGSDLKVVNCARVSFAKRSDWHREVHGEFDGDEYVDVATLSLKEKDARLIKYLASHKHELPFAHCGATFHMEIPFFVWNQLRKHQVGFVVSEVSRRYVSSTPSYFMPELRGQALDKKQGSEGGVQNERYARSCISDVYNAAILGYEELLNEGVCEEQARIVLPLGAYTEIMWSGSLLGWARAYNLRVAPDAQKETGDVMRMVGEYLAIKFPVSWRALTDG